MTWVIAASTILGYGVIISDTCVTFSYPDGSQKTQDCLQKIYWVGPSILAGFAGSVKIGFDLIQDLTDFLKIPEEEQGNGPWIPKWVAENWQERARAIYCNNPREERNSRSEVLMVCAHPTEDHGSPRDPKIYVIKMISPGFEPMVIFNPSNIFSIGSGSDIPVYVDALKELTPESGFHPLMQLDVGNTGGWASGIGFVLSQTIRNHPQQGISKHLHIGVVTRRKYCIIPNDWSETNGDKIIEFKMPKVARDWNEFLQITSTMRGANQAEAQVK